MPSERKTSLTGIKPTNEPHLGNYLGAIRPALELSATYDTYYFIADYHALTIVRDREAMRKSVYDVAATWLACGLDPDSTTFFRQSDVPEVFELAWVLSCMVATGQLERGHSYKDALAKGDAPNAGIFNYPVLMAADIVLYDTNVVPVGKDQKQHLELTRDMATRFNHVFGGGEEILVVPEPLIGEAQLVPGLDGHKMSKSRGNGIALFWPQKKLRKTIMKIVTGSEPLEAPKEPEGTLYELTRLLTPHVAETMAEKLRAGGYGWGHAKQDFFEALDAELAPMRTTYEALRADEAAIDAMLAEGAARARATAGRTMERVRHAIGMR
ncbi:MAG: tryptophan--tRNA ligase [Myxococcota bacterium]